MGDPNFNGVMKMASYDWQLAAAWRQEINALHEKHRSSVGDKTTEQRRLLFKNLRKINKRLSPRGNGRYFVLKNVGMI